MKNTTTIELTAKQIGLLLGLLDEADIRTIYTTPEEFTVHGEIVDILEDAENEIYS